MDPRYWTFYIAVLMSATHIHSRVPLLPAGLVTRITGFSSVFCNRVVIITSILTSMLIRESHEIPCFMVTNIALTVLDLPLPPETQLYTAFILLGIEVCLDCDN